MPDTEDLRKRIAELEAENSRLRLNRIPAEMDSDTLAFDIAESIEKSDGSWCYEGDDLPGHIAPRLMPVFAELATLRDTVRLWERLTASMQEFRIHSPDGDFFIEYRGREWCVSFHRDFTTKQRFPTALAALRAVEEIELEKGTVGE